MSTLEVARAAGERPLLTPEGVDLRVRIATTGERASALLVDLAILLGVSIAGTLVLAGTAAAMGEKAGEYLFVVFAIGGFLLRNAWFIIFELTPAAATPGKRALGLRVAARNGGRLTAEAILARNAMRELELFLPMSLLLYSAFSPSSGVDGWANLMGVIWAGVFALFPMFNRDHLRVGDLLAGTWVVHAPKVTLLRDLIDDRPMLQDRFAFTQAQLDAYGVKELHVLEDVLRTLDRKVMTAVAERIRRKIDWVAESDEMDQTFLSAYYAALRGRLETRMLLGKRKRDKFDTA